MKDLLQQLKEYLANASQKQLQRDWDELAEYNQCGPNVLDFVNGKMKLTDSIGKATNN